MAAPTPQFQVLPILKADWRRSTSSSALTIITVRPIYLRRVRERNILIHEQIETRATHTFYGSRQMSPRFCTSTWTLDGFEAPRERQ